MPAFALRINPRFLESKDCSQADSHQKELA
jgi:hypothetical protein